LLRYIFEHFISIKLIIRVKMGGKIRGKQLGLGFAKCNKLI
jgi:hypothetical protein